MARLEYRLSQDPGGLAALRATIEQRYDALLSTTGLKVFDALILLAVGSSEPRAIRNSFERMRKPKQEMVTGRKVRLVRLRFGAHEAEQLSSLHTRNFM